MPVRIFDIAPVNIDIEQKRPATLSRRRGNAPTPTPGEKRRQRSHRWQRSRKEQRQPLRVRARLFRARLNKKEYTPVYNHTQQDRNERQRPQQDSQRRRTTEKDGDHQREALTKRKERRRGEGRRGARRPMFRAEQLTGGDRQRRRVPRLHAVTIRRAAAATDKTAKTGGNRQIRDRKRTK